MVAFLRAPKVVFQLLELCGTPLICTKSKSTFESKKDLLKDSGIFLMKLNYFQIIIPHENLFTYDSLNTHSCIIF